MLFFLLCTGREADIFGGWIVDEEGSVLSERRWEEPKGWFLEGSGRIVVVDGSAIPDSCSCLVSVPSRRGMGAFPPRANECHPSSQTQRLESLGGRKFHH
jgi:hypothetical protein